MKFKDFLRSYPTTPIVIVFALAVSAVSFRLGETAVAIVELALGAMLSAVLILAERRDFAALNKSVEFLSQQIAGTDGTSTSDLPLPVVMCRDDGSIVWYNQLFSEQVIGENELAVRRIRHFLPESKLQDNAIFNASLGGKTYELHVKAVIVGDKTEYLICFVDITGFWQTSLKYKASRPVVLLITIDDIDNVSSSVDQNEFSVLVNDAEKLIRAWLEKYRSVVRRINDGKFFSICEYEDFKSMQEDKFSVLKAVRELRIDGFDKTVTISCGVGLGAGLTESEKTARKSLDMARGRGGDQVVIYDGNEYSFFGGVVSGVASDDRVKARIVATSVRELIYHAGKVYIMGHKSSDFDAVGAAIGMAETVYALGRTAYVVYDSETTLATPLIDLYRKAVDPKLREMFISPDQALSDIRDNDLVIVVDTMRRNLVESPELLEKAKKSVVIDHHRMAVGTIDDSLLFYHEPNVSSACEMVTQLIRYIPNVTGVSKAAAEALLSGIYLDTKGFTMKTGAGTFEAAGYLRDIGADTVRVRKLFAYAPSEKTDIEKIAATAEFKYGCAFAVSAQNGKNTRVIASKAADELLNIEGVDASFVVYPNENGAAISARSYGKVNVQRIMEDLGGGGHFCMAGAQLDDSSVEDAYYVIKKTTEKFFNE